MCDISTTQQWPKRFRGENKPLYRMLTVVPVLHFIFFQSVVVTSFISVIQRLVLSTFLSFVRQWKHLSISQNDTTLSIYLNNNIHTIWRPYYYSNSLKLSTFGSSLYWSYYGKPLNAYLDDVMFFNRSLNYSEIQTVMSFQSSQTTTTSPK